MSIKPIWFWLFSLVIVCFAAYVAWRNYPWWGDSTDKWLGWIMGGFITCTIAGLSMPVGFWFADYLGAHSSQVWEENWRGKMVSMRNADGVKGSISGGLFILSGQVESSQVYHYYYQSGTAFKPDSWTVDPDTFVYEEERTDGEIVQSRRVFKRRWLAWIAEPSDRHRMDFHIPKGALKQSFSLQ